MTRISLKPLIMNTQQLPQLSIGEALKAACNKIFQFNGRSRRSEFWWTALVVIIICAITHDTISWLLNLSDDSNHIPPPARHRTQRMVVGSRNNRHVWVRHNIRHRLRNQLINQFSSGSDISVSRQIRIVCHRIYRLPHSHDCVPLPRQRTV